MYDDPLIRLDYYIYDDIITVLLIDEFFLFFCFVFFCRKNEWQVKSKKQKAKHQPNGALIMKSIHSRNSNENAEMLRCFKINEQLSLYKVNKIQTFEKNKMSELQFYAASLTAVVASINPLHQECTHCVR